MDLRELRGTGGKGEVATGLMTAGEAVREASAKEKHRGSWGRSGDAIVPRSAAGGGDFFRGHAA